MKIPEQRLTLKNGLAVTLSSAVPEDAEAMLAYLRTVMGESDFLAYYPDEITTDVGEEAEMLKKLENSPKSAMLIARLDGRIIGSLGLFTDDRRSRFSHWCSIGLSVLNEFQGLGLGMAIMQSAIEVARAAGLEQMNLEVFCANEKAIALYTKLGFKIYGRGRNIAKYRDGRYDDELLMTLKL